MGILFGVLLGVLLAGTAGLLLLASARLPVREEAPQPLPCIGQHWQLRGVGPVQITGLHLHNDSGKIYAVKYTHRVAGRVLFEGSAPLKAFLGSAVLVEPPTAPYQALPSPVSGEVH